ncbi:glycoside hydrolase family 97 protein [Tamlana agarivorans]|uniref:Glycoside hydrolase family 97 protein n=1 Tax=Pseudotamlana agarivorans TaxID=481183 RepID=A0ACC5U9H6_9FLAO|nr:glycoside hydrolase family 97 protein [Tamlana agarivorans]MBU2950899.1 glycoside hydrolase family 97 protein [Tamlana agarivorans]
MFSPDKTKHVVVGLENDSIYYSFFNNKIPVIQKSLMGIELNEMAWKGLSVTEVKKDASRTQWEPLWGTQQSYPDYYNALTVKLKDKNSNTYTLLLRMYNEGLAFKYEFEIAEKSSLTLKNELTEFNMANHSKSWVLAHPWGKKYKKNMQVSQIKKVSLPLLSKSEKGHYIFITEAGLYNYGSLHLSANPNGSLSAEIVGDVKLKPEFKSPWRVVMVADAPAYFVEHSYLIQNLNPPSKIKNTSWIKPGISTWDWRARGAKEDGFEYQLNTESMLRFIDKTSELGLPYFMIDAGWYGAEHEKASNPLTTIPEIDLPRISKRAKEKNVGLWLYVNRVAFEAFDTDTLLAKYKAWGVVGIKLGFLREQNQTGVALLQHVLEKCADYELMLDCHEAVIPSGIERTWPHFLTREYNHSFMDGGYVASPVDHTITPFLNNVAGPIDVTPGFFDIDKMKARTYVKSELKSTIIAQAAMCVTYFSPLLCLPDIPEAYQRKPDVFEFIKGLPLSYDASKVLIGDIEKTYVVARRKDTTWWIGGVTNEKGGEIEFPLEFLGEGNYEATIFLDGKHTTWDKNREEFTKENSIVHANETLKLNIAPGGGVCIKLELK